MTSSTPRLPVELDPGDFDPTPEELEEEFKIDATPEELANILLGIKQRP